MAGPSRKEMIQSMLLDAPNDPELRYSLAMEHKSCGELEDAIGVFRDLEQRHPEYVPTYLQLGQVLTALDREDEAKAVYRLGIEVANKVNDMHAAGEMEDFLDGLE